MKALILAAVLCGLAASVAHAGSKPGVSSGAGLGNAAPNPGTSDSRVTSYGTRVGTTGTGDGNRGAQGHAATAGGHRSR